MEYLLTIIIGLFSGAAGSIIAPWIHWGIEKKRYKIKARRDLISRAREFISSKEFDAFGFSENTYYIQLKPYFDKNIIGWVEEFDNYYHEVDDNSKLCDDLKTNLMKQLHRIESEWGLI